LNTILLLALWWAATDYFPFCLAKIGISLVSKVSRGLNEFIVAILDVFLLLNDFSFLFNENLPPKLLFYYPSESISTSICLTMNGLLVFFKFYFDSTSAWTREVIRFILFQSSDLSRDLLLILPRHELLSDTLWFNNLLYLLAEDSTYNVFIVVIVYELISIKFLNLLFLL